MQKTLGEIAALCNGEVIGNEKIKISGVAGIKEAKEGEITFIANLKYISDLENTSASAVIVPEEVEQSDKPLIRTKNPYLAFAKTLNLFYTKSFKPKGIDKNTIIGKNSKLGKDVSIYPFVYIGENVIVEDNAKLYPHVFIDDNAKIKKNSQLYSGVKVYHECVIGENCIVHSGAVIGSDGFGFAPDENNVYRKIPQLGNVIVEDNVEDVCRTRTVSALFIVPARLGNPPLLILYWPPVTEIAAAALMPCTVIVLDVTSVFKGTFV